MNENRSGDWCALIVTIGIAAISLAHVTAALRETRDRGAAQRPARLGTMTNKQFVFDLDAFIAEHRRCGDLDNGTANERVWMTCSCGARIERPVEMS
jgi:hypothetical protein